ncbi:MAG TPA: DMT family transporter [Steroidobacteraceae bacterium]|nr:DMT family transporter [Steroidobacteraceae bacterium]
MVEPHTLPSQQRRVWLALASLAILWSLNWSVMKIANDYSGALTFSAQRYALGTVTLFIALIFRGHAAVRLPWRPTVVIGLTQTTAFQGLAQLALVHGGAGKVALLAYTMPFWVVPLAWWWLHEKPGPFRWACIALAAMGFVCVVGPWERVGDLRSIAFALGAGLAWAIATVVSKRLFQQYPTVTPLQLTAWQMLVGTMALIILALVIPERHVDWTTPYILALLYNGLLSSGLCWMLWALIVQRLSASVSGMTSLAVPIAGVLFAWALLGERPSGVEWIGIALIGTALLALNLRLRGGGTAASG